VAVDPAAVFAIRGTARPDAWIDRGAPRPSRDGSDRGVERDGQDVHALTSQEAEIPILARSW
jgi:hypothetical protein